MGTVLKSIVGSFGSWLSVNLLSSSPAIEYYPWTTNKTNDNAYSGSEPHGLDFILKSVSSFLSQRLKKNNFTETILKKSQIGSNKFIYRLTKVEIQSFVQVLSDYVIPGFFLSLQYL